jgi:hypothetical protein
MRTELQSLSTALRGLAALMKVDPAPFDAIALGLDAVFDCHLQRIGQLEARVGELADELDAEQARREEIADDLEHALGRLSALDGEKSY